MFGDAHRKNNQCPRALIFYIYYCVVRALRLRCLEMHTCTARALSLAHTARLDACRTCGSEFHADAHIHACTHTSTHTLHVWTHM